MNQRKLLLLQKLMVCPPIPFYTICLVLPSVFVFSFFLLFCMISLIMDSINYGSKTFLYGWCTPNKMQSELFILNIICSLPAQVLLYT